MSATIAMAVEVVSCVLAGVAGWCASRVVLARQAAFRQRRMVRRSAGVDDQAPGVSSEGGIGMVVRYATRLSKRLACKTTPAITRSENSLLSRMGGKRRGAWVVAHAKKAGLANQLSPEGYREACVRLSLAFAVAGGLLGAMLSNELALLLSVLGLVCGGLAPRRALRAAERWRTAEVERYLSEMLEVVALGLRSGLSFDHSFGLYAQHFSSSFAHACASTQRRWSLGLSTRDEALRDLAASFDSEQLMRITEGIIRSLRFGSSLAEGLEAAAVEARAEHRARMEERAAKAPVKMMMPTGALILPAMLLLVLGPVLLDLSSGF